MALILNSYLSLQELRNGADSQFLFLSFYYFLMYCPYILSFICDNQEMALIWLFLLYLRPSHTIYFMKDILDGAFVNIEFLFYLFSYLYLFYKIYVFKRYFQYLINFIVFFTCKVSLNIKYILSVLKNSSQ